MWSINGKSIQTTKGASLTWENHQFFTLEYQGKSFHGEILENDLENNRLPYMKLIAKENWMI